MHKDIHKFQHILQGIPQHSPHACATIQYGAKVKYVDHLDTTEYLSSQEINIVQQVFGTFLYYTIVIDNTILPMLSDIYTKQSKATKQTAPKLAQLLNYLANHPDAAIQYRASGMQLAIHSDTS